jgi:uncharacterized protein (TIGR02922 family)
MQKTQIQKSNQIKITVIYYIKTSLELKHDYIYFDRPEGERIVLTKSYKKDKSIIAVCEGHITFLNKLGERVTSQMSIAG